MIGRVQIIFGSGWKKQHLTCGLEVGGRGGGANDGIRAHLSAGPNNTMATAQRCDEMNDSQREGHQGGGGEALQQPAWHSRLGEQIPPLQLFSKASCWHGHFGAPAENSTAETWATPALKTHRQVGSLLSG